MLYQYCYVGTYCCFVKDASKYAEEVTVLKDIENSYKTFGEDVQSYKPKLKKSNPSGACKCPFFNDSEKFKLY